MSNGRSPYSTPFGFEHQTTTSVQDDEGRL